MQLQGAKQSRTYRFKINSAAWKLGKIKMPSWAISVGGSRKWHWTVAIPAEKGI